MAFVSARCHLSPPSEQLLSFALVAFTLVAFGRFNGLSRGPVPGVPGHLRRKLILVEPRGYPLHLCHLLCARRSRRGGRAVPNRSRIVAVAHDSDTTRC